MFLTLIGNESLSLILTVITRPPFTQLKQQIQIHNVIV